MRRIKHRAKVRKHQRRTQRYPQGSRASREQRAFTQRVTRTLNMLAPAVEQMASEFLSGFAGQFGLR